MPSLADGLTSAQQAAVTHPGGPLLVTGASGSGRTTVLEHRLAWLAEQGAPADQLLALAATPQAAQAMRSRLYELVRPPYDELRVHTFGSFCEALLRDEAVEAGLDPDFVPVAPAERVALLLEESQQLTLRQHEIRGNPAPLLAGFVSRIDRLKEEMVTPDELTAHAEGLLAAAEHGDDAARTAALREREFAQLYADHDGLLAARGALDTGDLILRAFALLHERPHVRSRVAAGLAAVLADDYQDANFAQGALLALLCEEAREVTVTGPAAGARPSSRARSPTPRRWPWTGACAARGRSPPPPARPPGAGTTTPRPARAAACASGAAPPSAPRRRPSRPAPPG